MSRYDIRISELTELGYTLDQAKELARAEETERQTNALERIADALDKKNTNMTISGNMDKATSVDALAAQFEKAREQAAKRIG